MSRFLVRRSDSVGVEYARAFFVTAPDASPLTAGETRRYRFVYAIGDPAATAFELHWYANRQDADAYRDRLTDTSRLPTAVFDPATPNTSGGATDLQNGSVILTAPTVGGYENPIAVVEMIQNTGDYIKPHIYLTEDMLVWRNYVEYRDYQFKYWIGNPPVRLFILEWYRSRLDANLMRNRLTDLNRLPRAVLTPDRPNIEAEPEEVQNGTLRLYQSTASNAYGYVVGLLCVSYLTEVDFNEDASVRRYQVFSNWDRGKRNATV